MSAWNAAEAAARGASFLDGEVPNWSHPNRIDLDALRLASCKRCVLGQLFGEYGEGVDDLGLSETDEDTLGFFAVDHEWADLTEAWRAEIRKRRHPKTADSGR